MIGSFVFFCFSQCHLDLDGAVVAAHDVGVDCGGLELGLEAVGAEPVVDAPAGVLLAGMESVAPPGVDVGCVGEEMTEGVGEPCGEQFGELGTLLVGETCVEMVGFGVLDVDFLVRHVHVATDEHGLRLVQSLEVEAEGVVPGHALGEALESVLRVGGVDGDDVELGVFECDDASLGEHLTPVAVGEGGDDVLGQTQGNGEGRVLGVDGGAGVAFPLGVVPVGLVAGEGEVELPCLHLGLLQTKEIRVERGEGLRETLAAHGAESVYIPGNEFHVCGELCELAEVHLVHVALLDEGVVECVGGSKVVP